MLRFGAATKLSLPAFRRNLATHALSTPAAGTYNLVEKIVQKYAVDLTPGSHVKSGDYVSIRPGTVMTHDNTGPVISKFGSIGATSIFNPDQVVFALDHDVQNKSAKNLEKYSKIESFARQHGIDFYPAGGGSGIRCWWRRGMRFRRRWRWRATRTRTCMGGGVFGYADCEDGCSGDLGDGPDVVADTGGGQGRVEGRAAQGRYGQRRHRGALRLL